MLQRDATAVQRERIARIERERAVKARHGILEPLQLEQGKAAIAESLGVAGGEGQRAIEARNGIVEPFEVEQCIAAVEVSLRIVRRKPKRTIVACERLL